MSNPTSSGNRKKIIVLGAGISGLTCAFRLHRAGFDVEVLERESSPGGVMQTRLQDGFLTEAGPNSFQSGEDILSLIHDAGLDGELLEAEASLPRYIFFRGKLNLAPLGPGALLTTPLLSTGAKWKLLREPWAPSNADGHEESIQEFVSRRLGPELHDVLLAPLVSGIYAGDTRRLSMQSVFPLMVELEQKYGSLLKGFLKHAKEERRKREAAGKPKPRRTLCSFTNGLKALPEGIARNLGSRLHVDCVVQSLQFTPERGFDLKATEKGVPKQFHSDGLVIASSVLRAGEHLKDLARSKGAEALQAAGEALQKVELPPLAGVCLAYKKTDVPHNLRGFGFLIPRSEKIRMLGCIWSSSLFAHRAPEGWVLLTNFIGGATDPAILDLTEGQLLEAVRKDLRTVLGITAPPRVVALNRYEQAIPQYNLGHKARIEEVLSAVSTVPGLAITGNYLSGVSVGDCVKQASELVRQICKEHGTAPDSQAGRED
ncbi:MAG: protoporphyrinogen oxidase [Acidobacteriia bacterium]|nr:protoporphyrinogen oxidase [Terriglobia bacterium]